MDYGDIFVSTFRIIWRHKIIWLFGMLGRVLVTLAGIASGILSVQMLPGWLSYFENLMTSPGATAPLPPNFSQQITALWSVLACAGLLGGLINYVINLIMRGATIHEARMAWEDRATDAGRGVRAGASRAVSLFVIDLLWWAPGILLAVLISVAGFVGLIGTAASAGNQNNPNALGGAILLGICGLCCCMILLIIGFAVLYGTFSPLMYQAAVWTGRTGGPRTAGEAIGQGWRLAREHWGAMFVFWLLLAVLTLAAGAVLTAVDYPLRAGIWGNLGDWFSTLFGDIGQGVQTPPPPLPAVNTGLLGISTIVQAILGLLIYGFLQSFALTLYAEVYRRLTGGSVLAPAGGAPELPPSPGAWEMRPAGPPAPPEAPAGGEGSMRIYDRPDDVGLSVPDEAPPDEDNRPRL